MNRINSRFRSGSGVYRCNSCGRQTRETGEGESQSGLCVDCFALAGIYNALLDEGRLSPSYKAEVKRRTEHITLMGGRIPGDFLELLEETGSE